MQRRSTPLRHPLPCDASLLASLGRGRRSQRRRTPVPRRWPARSVPCIRTRGRETTARSSSVDVGRRQQRRRPLVVVPHPVIVIIYPEDIVVHRVVGEGQLGAPTDVDVASGVVLHNIAPPSCKGSIQGRCASKKYCSMDNLQGENWKFHGWKIVELHYFLFYESI